MSPKDEKKKAPGKSVAKNEVEIEKEDCEGDVTMEERDETFEEEADEEVAEQAEEEVEEAAGEEEDAGEEEEEAEEGEAGEEAEVFEDEEEQDYGLDGDDDVDEEEVYYSNPENEEAEPVKEACENEDEAAKSDSEVLSKTEAKRDEQEHDEAEDHRPVLTELVVMNDFDCTVNACISSEGNALTVFKNDGLLPLLAGVRATVGVARGRAYFEVRILDMSREVSVKNVDGCLSTVRVGVGSEDSSLIIGGERTIGWGPDSFFKEGQKTKAKAFSMGDVLGVLINLQEGHPMQNTISLYRNGSRWSEPQKLPENLVGVPLFPLITYRDATVLTNFGAQGIMAPLEFKVRMLGDCAAEDVVFTPARRPEDGVYEVVMPVAIPGSGIFDWSDEYLAMYPGKYVEVSNRSVIEWFRASGFTPRAHNSNSSMDNPGFAFRESWISQTRVSLAAHTIRLLLANQRRHVFILDMAKAITDVGRRSVLEKFNAKHFDIKAFVVAGQPPLDFVERQRAMEKARLFELSLAQRSRKETKEPKEGEEPEEELPATADDMVIPADLEFRKMPLPDISDWEVSNLYLTFTFPTSEEMVVEYPWEGDDSAAHALAEWKKETALVQPNKSFMEAAKGGDETCEEMKKAFEAAYEGWMTIYRNYRGQKRKAAQEDLKAAKELLQKNKEDGEEVDVGTLPSVRDCDIFAENLAEAVDPWGVDNVDDLGDGVPLYRYFYFEDFALLRLRFQVCFLIQNFARIVPDMEGLHQNLLPVYFKAFFKEDLSPVYFGRKDLSQVLELINDTVALNAKGCLVTEFSVEESSLTTLVRLVEECRARRVARIASGDESARVDIKRDLGKRRKNGKFAKDGKGKGRTGKGVKTIFNQSAAQDGKHLRGDKSKGKSRGKGKGKGAAPMETRPMMPSVVMREERRTYMPAPLPRAPASHPVAPAQNFLSKPQPSGRDRRPNAPSSRFERPMQMSNPPQKASYGQVPYGRGSEGRGDRHDARDRGFERPPQYESRAASRDTRMYDTRAHYDNRGHYDGRASQMSRMTPQYERVDQPRPTVQFYENRAAHDARSGQAMDRDRRQQNTMKRSYGADDKRDYMDNKRQRGNNYPPRDSRANYR